ncbi:TPA: response regulator [Candidatus Poribacteria bacterium]|nr:response regulator [Candidatus Poribacteria bacterium]
MERRKILIVEDNARNRRLLKVLLRSHGYLVAEAQNGAETLNALERDPPDLILMDIQLPGMDGLELVKRIKEGFGDIPIIAVTAYAMKGDRERILSAGCDGYVSKPIDTRELPKVIAKTLEDRYG